MAYTYSPAFLNLSPISSDIFIATPNIAVINDVILTTSPLTPLINVISLDPLPFQTGLIALGTVNNSPETRYKMVKYVYYLVLDDWLTSDLSEILNYFTYNKDGTVSVVKNLDEVRGSINMDSESVMEKKIDYIEKNVFSKLDMAKVLVKFTEETNTTWVDIPKNKHLLKSAVKTFLVKRIKELLSEKKRD